MITSRRPPRRPLAPPRTGRMPPAARRRAPPRARTTPSRSTSAAPRAWRTRTGAPPTAIATTAITGPTVRGTTAPATTPASTRTSGRAAGRTGSAWNRRLTGATGRPALRAAEAPAPAAVGADRGPHRHPATGASSGGRPERPRARRESCTTPEQHTPPVWPRPDCSRAPSSAGLSLSCPCLAASDRAERADAERLPGEHSAPPRRVGRGPVLQQDRLELHAVDHGMAA